MKDETSTLSVLLMQPDVSFVWPDESKAFQSGFSLKRTVYHVPPFHKRQFMFRFTELGPVFVDPSTLGPFPICPRFLVRFQPVDRLTRAQVKCLCPQPCSGMWELQVAEPVGSQQMVFWQGLAFGNRWCAHEAQTAVVHYTLVGIN